MLCSTNIETRIPMVYKQSIKFILWRRFSKSTTNANCWCLWRNIFKHRNIEHTWFSPSWTVRNSFLLVLSINSILIQNYFIRCTNPSFLGCERVGTSPSILNPVRSAKIRTIDSFAFKYGKVEISAKMPTGDWLHPGMVRHFCCYWQFTALIKFCGFCSFIVPTKRQYLWWMAVVWWDRFDSITRQSKLY